MRRFLLFRRRTLVDEIDDAHIGDAGVRLKTYLAGAAVAVAHLDFISLYLRTKLAQSVAIQLGEGEAPVASEAAAAYTLGQEDASGAHLGKVDEIVGHTHLPR